MELLANEKSKAPVYSPTNPHLPFGLEVRTYLIEAIDEWFAHDCRGLLEMATGTGKTKTALSASVRLFEREKRLAVIIAVPYQHLVDQWDTESQEFGYRPILAYQSKGSWFCKLRSKESEMRFVVSYTVH